MIFRSWFLYALLIHAVGAGHFLRLQQFFGRFDSSLADADQLLGEFHHALGNQYFVEASPHVGEHATPLRCPGEFRLPDFLAGEEDLGTKWAPRFVRVTDKLPETATTKVVKRVLRNESWHCEEPVWWRPAKDAPYRRLTTTTSRSWTGRSPRWPGGPTARLRLEHRPWLGVCSRA